MAKRQGLGKGLESLIGEANAEVGSGSTGAAETTIPISKVTPSKVQPRTVFDEAELEELADSIRQNGIIQPLVVRKKGQKYEIIAGERRYRAAKLANLEEIPAVVREVNDEDAYRLALIENLQRTDLNPMEEALGYSKLMRENNLTQEQLAKLVSKSRPSVANTLRLLDLPEDVQELLHEGKLTAGHARALLMVPTQEGRSKLAKKVVDEGLSVRKTEQIAPLFSSKRLEAPKRTPQPQSYKRAARQLRLALDASVKVRTVRGKNKIEIEFTSDEDLARIVDTLVGGDER